ncbi:class I tRNA ligase family protein [Streptomyces sp. NPDC058470]|uniref:class I tRNA ligase family protein n=1 Tax=Streptomyces sp. NPDC058470 TaxID=3346515 RepID=UPI003657170A
MRLHEEPQRRYLISAGYHTPNGPLHLGHLGGPFLHGNVLARHLESLGHEVWQITGTDAHESYVLLSAVVEGTDPRSVSGPNHASAEQTLNGFGMGQTAFADTGGQRLAADYARHSHDIARFLVERGRVEVRDVDMLRSRSTGRVVVGPFAVGDCPACGAGAAGTCCEECGVWFGPERLRNTRPRLPVDDDLEPIVVPTAYLRLSESFNAKELAGRFPERYLHLADDYLALNGPWVALSHPLGWGVPWEELPGPPAPEAVHTSYALGTYASNRILRDLFGAATGLGDPFAHNSGITTVLTSGLDAVLPCMFLHGLADPDLDWHPYERHVLNEFMLLDGEKFSTTRQHVITGGHYLAAGLDPGLFRFYAALVTDPDRPADFRVADFAAFCQETVVGRLDPLVAQCLDRDPENTGIADAAAPFVRARATALSVDDPDIRAGAEGVLGWLRAGEAGLAAERPYGWLRVLAWLAWPYLPGRAEELWGALGLTGAPRLSELEPVGGAGPVTRAVPGRYRPPAVPTQQRIAALLRPADHLS